MRERLFADSIRESASRIKDQAKTRINGLKPGDLLWRWGISVMEGMSGHKKGEMVNSDLDFGTKDIIKKSENGDRPTSSEDPFSDKHVFEVVRNIRKRARSEEGLEAMVLAREAHHWDVLGEVPAYLENIPGVVVFDGERPRNETELNEALKNNEDLKGLVGNLQKKGKNVWAQADAHKGVVLTVAAVAAGVVGAGIYLHHKKEENKIGKVSSLIFKKKK